jgi:hypothetical protein
MGARWTELVLPVFGDLPEEVGPNGPRTSRISGESKVIPKIILCEAAR